MTDYVVGDIQGCYSGLRRLLDKAKFDPKKDKLYAVGDLIARGSESLETLAYLYSLKDSFDTVLGNHDLHFLAIAAGLKDAKKSDLLGDLLAHKKCDKYVQWLREKPLAIQPKPDVLITHAGLYPAWSFKKALSLSQEVQTRLTHKKWLSLLSSMYGNEPARWDNQLVGDERLRFVINAFTRMRYLKENLSLEFSTKSAPTYAPQGLQPWFGYKNKKLNKKQIVVFGHWAALMGKTGTSQFIGLDTGYVWGNQMTLLNLDKNKLISVCQVKN